MFGEQIGIKVAETLLRDPKDKPLAQSQIQPVLDRRFEPCLELWKVLWMWGEDTFKEASAKRPTTSAGCDVTRFEHLLEIVDRFLMDCGALVSLGCFSALCALQSALKEAAKLEGTEATYPVMLKKVMDLLYPSESRNSKGQVDGKNPGLLLLLRDELGSNAPSAASNLK